MERVAAHELHREVGSTTVTHVHGPERSAEGRQEALRPKVIRLIFPAPEAADTSASGGTPETVGSETRGGSRYRIRGNVR